VARRAERCEGCQGPAFRRAFIFTGIDAHPLSVLISALIASSTDWFAWMERWYRTEGTTAYVPAAQAANVTLALFCSGCCPSSVISVASGISMSSLSASQVPVAAAEESRLLCLRPSKSAIASQSHQITSPRRSASR
jgi:hypothetical protein